MLALAMRARSSLSFSPPSGKGEFWFADVGNRHFLEKNRELQRLRSLIEATLTRSGGTSTLRAPAGRDRGTPQTEGRRPGE